jgi:hypothetical protein
MAVTKVFDWERTPQLSPGRLLIATFLPSAIAFVGFHAVLPAMVSSGVPTLVGWPVVATVMLALFSLFSVFLLRREAAHLGISTSSRMCLCNPTRKAWLISLGAMIAVITLVIPIAKIIGPLRRLVGFEIPTYMPFFLNPELDPMTTNIEILSPGFPISRKY